MNVTDKLKSLSIDRSAPPASNASRRLLVVGAVVIALAAVAWIFFRNGSPPATNQTNTSNVAAPSIDATTPARARGGLLASGYVVARRSATVSIDITGRLTEVLFEEGAFVEKGQVLARMDDDLARYDLQLARGRLQSANAAIASLKAQMVEADAQRQRAEKLVQTGAVSAASYETATSRINSLTAQYNAAMADARVTQTSVDRQTEFVERHVIRAPFAGLPLNRYIIVAISTCVVDGASPGQRKETKRMSRNFTRTPTVRAVVLAPQTTAGDKRAFDMRPKITKEPRHEPRAHVARESEALLLDELKA